MIDVVAQVVAFILIASGLTKTVNPAPAAKAISLALDRPAQAPGVAAASLARVVGSAELALGILGLFQPKAWVLAATAAMFVGFNLFLSRLYSRHATADCGCFGTSGDGDRTHLIGGGPAHRITNVAIAACLAAGAAAATTPSGAVTSLPSTLNGLGLAMGRSYIVVLLTAAWLVATGPALFDTVTVSRGATSSTRIKAPNEFALLPYPTTDLNQEAGHQ